MRISRNVPIIAAVVAVLAAAAFAQECGAGADVPVEQATAPAEKQPQVVLRADTAFAYCALEMTGSYDQHSTAFEKLYGAAMQQGIYGGTPFGVYWNSPSNTPVEKLSWDVGFALPAGQTPKEPLKVKQWPFTTMAVIEYSGSFADSAMAGSYAAIFNWIGENGYKPAGPCMEAYLNIPSPDEKGVLVGTVEIIVPVEKAPPARERKTK